MDEAQKRWRRATLSAERLILATGAVKAPTRPPTLWSTDGERQYAIEPTRLQPPPSAALPAAQEEHGIRNLP